MSPTAAAELHQLRKMTAITDDVIAADSNDISRTDVSFTIK